MFYHLFDYLQKEYNLTGAGLFQYISFRSSLAVFLSLLITILFGKKIIRILKNNQIDENIRNLGLTGQTEKSGTPSMGGIIIIGATLIPVLLFSNLENIYIIILISATLGFGLIGFIDDYIKIFKKRKSGLSSKLKIIFQMIVGIVIGLTLYFNNEVTIREYNTRDNRVTTKIPSDYQEIQSPVTNIPFKKNNILNYDKVIPFVGEENGWIVYILVVTFIITAVSNGANLTDGIDGLASGISAIVVAVIGIFSYLSGRVDFSYYLNILYIPNLSEIVIFCSALIGACVGFLWYNSYPAQVFMGDTGSLTLGGIIAVLAVIVRKELLLPLLCGVFLIESVSVIIQVLYFKYTKKKFGEGRRIFKMAPLHHHYQKMEIHESKIVTRFWMVGLLLAILTLATIKIR